MAKKKTTKKKNILARAFKYVKLLVKDIIVNPARYRKFLASLATVAVAVISQVFTDATWAPAVLGVLGSFTVLGVTNEK